MSTKDDREHLLSGEEHRRRRRQQEGKEGKRSVGKRVLTGVLGTCILALLALLGLYGAGVVYFQDRFFMNTTINGFDASQMTVEEVERQIAGKIGSYRLEVALRGGASETITADQIGYVYVSQGETQKFKDSQKPFLWPLSFLEKASYSFQSSARYDKDKLEQAIDGLACMDEEQAVRPKDAYIDFVDGGYYIVPEVEGTLLNREMTGKKISRAVEEARAKVSLDEGGCYETPGRRQDDKTLASACKALNTFIQTDITYLFGENRESLDGKEIRRWIVYEDGQEPSINADYAYAFVAGLAEKYDTADKPRKFRTHDGAQVTVSGGYYGWVIDQETEVQELLSCIREGFRGERYAVFAQTAVSWENSDIGSSYVEVDLGKQHVWMYVDGQEIVSTDCVSGDMMKSEQSTPEGTYTLYYKESPAVLEDEKKTYRTEVTYWMPFNGGIGLHDAAWRGSFGGNINQSNGSHGCINLPLEAAKTIYENIYAGMPIICYYG